MTDSNNKNRELIEFGALHESAPDDLTFLEKELKDLNVEPLSNEEAAMLSERLDVSISRFRYQAFGLYRFMTRYAVSAAAVLLLVVMGSLTQFSVEVPDSTTVAVSEYTMDDEEVLFTLIDDDEINENLDDEYINTVVNSYVWSSGDGASGQLLNEITTEEYDYLINSFNAEDML